MVGERVEKISNSSTTIIWKSNFKNLCCNSLFNLCSLDGVCSTKAFICSGYTLLFVAFPTLPLQLGLAVLVQHYLRWPGSKVKCWTNFDLRAVWFGSHSDRETLLICLWFRWSGGRKHWKHVRMVWNFCIKMYIGISSENLNLNWNRTHTHVHIPTHREITLCILNNLLLKSN
jgi:hypothetical protein